MKLQFPLITSKPTATFAVMTKDLVDAGVHVMVSVIAWHPMLG